MLRFVIALLAGLVTLSSTASACSVIHYSQWEDWHRARNIVVATVMERQEYNTEGLAEVDPWIDGSVRDYLQRTPRDERPWLLLRLRLDPGLETHFPERMNVFWGDLTWRLPFRAVPGRKYLFAIDSLGPFQKRQVEKTAKRIGETIGNLAAIQRFGCNSVFIKEIAPKNTRKLEMQGLLPYLYYSVPRPLRPLTFIG